MNLNFRFELNQHSFSGAASDAVVTVLLEGLEPKQIEPRGEALRPSDGQRQWFAGGNAVKLTATFTAKKNGQSRTLRGPADVAVIFESTGDILKPNEPETIEAVLLAGSLVIGVTEELSVAESELVNELVPPGVKALAVRFEPSGLHVECELPRAFFPVETGNKPIVLRVPQRSDTDTETFDLKSPRPCWTLTGHRLAADAWTAREFVNATAKALSGGSVTIIDNVVTPDDQDVESPCAVRLAVANGGAQWVARQLGVRVSLAAGSGDRRTSEAQFFPDVLIGGFAADGSPTTPTQFQALPHDRKNSPVYDADLDKADYRLVVKGEKVSSLLSDQKLAATVAPVRPPRTGEPDEEAWLCLNEGWLALSGPSLRTQLQDVSSMRQLTNTLDPFALERAFNPDRKAPQGSVRLSVVDQLPGKVGRSSLVALTIPKKSQSLGLYLWRPLVELITPSLWAKFPAVSAPVAKDELNQDIDPDGERFVPSLFPPAGGRLEDYDPTAHLGHAVFTSAEYVNSQDKTATATLQVTDGGWSVRLTAPTVRTWVHPPGLPLVAAFPFDETPRADTALDDRRGLVPLLRKKEGVGITVASEGLPQPNEPITKWFREAPAELPEWTLDPVVDGRKYFLTTLPGVEWSFATGLPALPSGRLRHANPALDESYARVTEDQQGRRRNPAEAADATRATEAVAFGFDENQAKGWVPGGSVSVALVDKPNLFGLSPNMEFRVVEGVEVKLSRPTEDNRHADLVHLTLKAAWDGDMTAPTVQVVKFNPAAEYSLLGSGQPLLVKSMGNGQPVRTMDALGHLREEADAAGRIRERRKGEAEVTTRVTESRSLGLKDGTVEVLKPLGDELKLELLGVTLGEFDLTLVDEQERKLRWMSLEGERWQLDDGAGKPPRLRGFPLRPVRLDALTVNSITLTVVCGVSDTIPGGTTVTVKFDQEENSCKQTVVSGGVDWVFPSSADGPASVPFVARLRASFAADTQLSDQSVVLQNGTVTLVFPFGRCELPCECRLVLTTDGWRMAFRGQRRETVEGVHVEYETAWVFVSPGQTGPPSCEAFRLQWMEKNAWELRYGQSADIRPTDLSRLKKTLETQLGAPLDAFLGTALKAMKDFAGLKPSEGKSEWKKVASDHQLDGEELVVRTVNEWLKVKTNLEVLEKLFENDQIITGWLRNRQAVDGDLTALEVSWLRRTLLDRLFDDSLPPADWRKRWHALLHDPALPQTELSIIGDAILDPVRVSARRLTFRITRDAYHPVDQRRKVARYLRLDSLGGILAAEVLHSSAGPLPTKVAIQLHLVLRDRLRRDALGIWSPKDKRFLVREDQIGEIQAFAGFGRINAVKQQDVAWAVRDPLPNGPDGAVFHRWMPRQNRLENWKGAILATPRKAFNTFPLKTRKLLVVDNLYQVSTLNLVLFNEPGADAEHEELLEPAVNGQPLKPVDLIATNYSFAGGRAAWTRQGVVGCKLYQEGKPLKTAMDQMTLACIGFSQDMVLASVVDNPNELYLTAYSPVATVKVPLPLPNVKQVLALDTLIGVSLVVVYRTEPDTLHMAWFGSPVEAFTSDTQTLNQGSLPVNTIDQVIALDSKVCAIRSANRVFVVSDNKNGGFTFTELDSGSLVPEEIDLLDDNIDNDTPFGDLLLRGPAAQTLCSAVLTHSGGNSRLELTGRLVLQNDVRFVEEKDGLEADCTHRLDLYLDRAAVPVSLLFGGPNDDHYLYGIAHHVFRFSDGAERIWQAPQVVRLTRVDRLHKELGWTDPHSDHRNELVFDASCVTWLQEPEGDTDLTTPPFDPRRRGRADVDNPLFALRLHSKPPVSFEKSLCVRLPFLASVEFEKLGGAKNAVPRFKVTIPKKPDDTTLLSRGGQYPLLSPRFVNPPQPSGDLLHDSIDFLSRTLQGRWLDSDFLQYSLLPEPEVRHDVARRQLGTAPLKSLDTGKAGPMIWPGFGLGEEMGRLPKELPDLAALRDFKGKSAGDIERGDRVYVAAATLARKTARTPPELTGPAVVEFPFFVEMRPTNYTDYEKLDAALRDREAPLADPRNRQHNDVQIVCYQRGEFRRLVRETFALPAVEDTAEQRKLDVTTLLNRGRELLRQRSFSDEALIIRDFHQVLGLPTRPERDAEELAFALPSLPLGDLEDPRLVPLGRARLTAKPELTPVVFAARPLADAEGKAGEHSATRWWMADTGGKVPGIVRAATGFPADHSGGWTVSNRTPFELATGEYPSPEPAVVHRLPSPKVDAGADAVVRPPWWQVAAWSDRPGELMTTAVRVSENVADSVGLSSEQSPTLRRARTVTPIGANVRLTPVVDGPPLPRWERLKTALLPQDLDLEQTLLRSEVPTNGVRLFITIDGAVYASADTAEGSGANPVLVPDSVTKLSLHLIGGPQWQPNQGGVFMVQKVEKVGTAVSDKKEGTEQEIDAEIDKHRQPNNAPDSNIVTDSQVKEAEANGRFELFVEVPVAGPNEFTLTLVQFVKTKPSTEGGKFELVYQSSQSLSVAVVPAASKLRPLKTSVAVLNHTQDDGSDATLVGYGQLGPDRFSAIRPAISVNGRLLVDWKRTARVRVIRRDPTKDWKYQAVVTGPGGETYATAGE